MEEQKMENVVEEVMPKKSKAGLIFTIVAILLVVVVIVVAFFMFGMKSKERKFLDLLLTKQTLVEYSEKEEAKAEKMEETKFHFSSDLATIMGASNGEKLVTEVNYQQIQQKGDFSGDLQLLLNDEEVAKIGIAKNDNLYGLKLEDDYVAIRNENLKELAEKLGIDDDTFPNKFLTKEDYEKVMKMSDADLNKIGNKYGRVLEKAIKGKVAVEKRATIEIDGKEYLTTKYSLKLSEKTIYQIMLAVVEELKDDKANIELVVNDLKSILQLMEDNGQGIPKEAQEELDEILRTDKIMEKLQSAYEEAKEEDITTFSTEEFFTISVFEYKGKTIATEMIVEGEENVTVGIACIEKGDFVTTIYMEQQNQRMELTLIGKNEGKTTNYQAIMYMDMNGAKVSMNLFDLSVEYVKKSKNKVEQMENPFILNDASKEELQAFFLELQESINAITGGK